jgi:hypothetical protein
MNGDTFYADLKRYGGRRAIARQGHNETRRAFVLRQRQLAIVAALQLAVYAFTGVWMFALLAVLAVSAGEGEARRMRACGRYWQCKRSMEVIGI